MKLRDRASVDAADDCVWVDQSDSPSRPTSGVELVAYVVSQVGSPPVLAISGMIITAVSASSGRAWMWAGVYISLAILTPLLYLVWLVRQGEVTDLDVQLREQRAKPLILTLICTGLGCLVLIVGSAPLEMVLLAATLWLQSLIIFVITLWWKISVHCATAAAFSTLLLHLLGTVLPLLVGVPLIAWSRIQLRRHTAAQTAAGALLGSSVLLLLLQLTSGG